MKKAHLVITIAVAVILASFFSVVAYAAEWIECRSDCPASRCEGSAPASQCCELDDVFGGPYYCCRLGGAISWFPDDTNCLPDASLSHIPNEPTCSDDITISINGSDDDSGLDRIYIWVRRTVDGSWGDFGTHTCDYSGQTSATCNYPIGSFPENTQIQYLVYTYDNANDENSNDGNSNFQSDSFTVGPCGNCSSLSQSECNLDPDCEWCDECEPITERYSGDVDRCVEIGTCNRVCDPDHCSPECTSDTDTNKIGTTCEYNCDTTDTCQYDDTCTLKCFGSDCKGSDNYCYYNVDCSYPFNSPDSDACKYTQGEFCPVGTCQPDGTCQECSLYSSQGTCEADFACDWCPQCSGNQYAGGPACVNAGTCPTPYCISGICGAQCSLGGSSWSGTTCNYNCNSFTCLYSGSCTTKCAAGTSYCKASDDYCYHSVGCTASGCAETQGQYCPVGTCQSDGTCYVPSCSAYVDPTNCESNPSCDWCPQCSGNQFAGGPACADTGTCPTPFCINGVCGAECVFGDRSQIGTTCEYNCNTNTCQYDGTCTLKCTGSYCKYNDVCYYNVGCTASGCSETQGDPCPQPYECQPDGSCVISCSLNNDQTSCEASPLCDWCPQCSGNQFAGGPACVDTGTCPSPFCVVTLCGAQCSAGGSSWTGTTCDYNCNSATCLFSGSCTTKCAAGTSYCKSSDYCYYNVGCTASGCSETQGDYCPTGTCQSDGSCDVPSCSAYSDQGNCESNPSCDWCPQCSGNRFAGGPACVNAGTCPSPFCVVTLCGAQCSAGGSSWSGTNCDYNCDSVSCSYSSSCQTKCSYGNSYCKSSDDYCYYIVGCTGTGCIETQGDFCPTGTCQSDGTCDVPSCSAHSDQGSCEANPSCDWCPQCFGSQYAGGPACVQTGECPAPFCVATLCSAECSGGGSSWTGTNCDYNCDSLTCSYSGLCETKCPSGSNYCKASDDYCYHSVNCISNGCIETQGDYCPSGVCRSDGSCGTACSSHPDQGTCEADVACDWCPQCSGNQYAGGPACVQTGTCPTPLCVGGVCSAQCSLGGSSWTGTTCDYNCNSATCLFSGSCQTKCSSTDYCKASDDYCYYSVGCTATGCVETQGDYCPTGTCNVNGQCVTETCDTDGDPNTNCYPYQCTDYSDCSSTDCSCPPGEYPCQGTCGLPGPPSCTEDGACPTLNEECCEFGNLLTCQSFLWNLEEDCNSHDIDNCWCTLDGATLSQFCDDWTCNSDTCADTGVDWQPNEWDCTMLTECTGQSCSENYICRYSNSGSWEWVIDPGTETACSDGYDNDCDSLIDALDPDCGCEITSILIGDCSGACSAGDDIPLTISYQGECPAEVYAQIDVHSPDGTCEIQAQNINGIDGYIKGIETQCTESPCSATWTIPGTRVPLACQGKTVTPKVPLSASINENGYPPSGTVLDQAGPPDVSGSFDFYINPADIEIVLELVITEVSPYNIANCNHGICPEIKINAVATVREMSGPTVVEEIPCDPINCRIKSIVIDGNECAATADMSPMCPEPVPSSNNEIWSNEYDRWEIPIDTMHHHSDVTITVVYEPSGDEGSDGESYGVNYPPDISNVQVSGDISIGNPVDFSATIIDPEADAITAAIVCNSEACTSPLSGCENMANTGDNYYCTHTIQLGDNEYWIYAQDVWGAFNTDGPYFLLPTTKYITPDLSYPYVDSQIIPLVPFGGDCDNTNGCPNFTKTMPIEFVLTAVIKDNIDPLYTQQCNDANCQAYYDINDQLTTSDWTQLSWDAFKKGWFTSESSITLGCDSYYNLHTMITTSGDITKISREKIFINCMPAITVEPIETSLILGEKNKDVFTVTIWNPTGSSNQYSTEMTAIREDLYPIPWVEFICSSPGCTVDPLNNDKVSLSVGAVSSNSVTVYLDTAVRAGVFPIRYVADDGIDQLTTTSNLLIYAEGLNEFALYQFIALILIATALYYKASIHRKR